MQDSVKKLFEVDQNKLPKNIPLFPLENILLLPFGKLPLNIFEERYIKMTLDSLKSHRMIGVIQPKNNNNELFMVGCIGKITSYIETPDYRIVLNLEGVCRFVLQKRDLHPNGYFFKMKKLEIDKDVLAETSNLQLLSTLAMLAPFNKIDKQAILESSNLLERLNTINSILDLNTFQVVANNGNQLN